MWQLLGRKLAVRRARRSTKNAKRKLDAQWREKLRYDRILTSASDAVLAAAPPDLPPIKERNLAIGIGLVRCGACYVFATDTGFELAKIKTLTQWLDQTTRKELLARGYPPDKIDEFHIWFTSHDATARKSGGNDHRYFH